MTAPIRPPRASRAPRFKQRDLERALKGALAAGLQVAGTLFHPDGRFELRYAGAGDVAPSAGSALERWREERRA
jgi:hypothetical protein